MARGAQRGGEGGGPSRRSSLGPSVRSLGSSGNSSARPSVRPTGSSGNSSARPSMRPSESLGSSSARSSVRPSGSPRNSSAPPSVSSRNSPARPSGASGSSPAWPARRATASGLGSPGRSIERSAACARGGGPSCPTCPTCASFPTSATVPTSATGATSATVPTGATGATGATCATCGACPLQPHRSVSSQPRGGDRQNGERYRLGDAAQPREPPATRLEQPTQVEPAQVSPPQPMVHPPPPIPAWSRSEAVARRQAAARALHLAARAADDGASAGANAGARAGASAGASAAASTGANAAIHHAAGAHSVVAPPNHRVNSATYDTAGTSACVSLQAAREGGSKFTLIGWVESALDALLSQGGRDRAPTTVASRAMLVEKAVRALKDHFVRGGSIAQGSTAQYGSVAEFEVNLALQPSPSPPTPDMSHPIHSPSMRLISTKLRFFSSILTIHQFIRPRWNSPRCSGWSAAKSSRGSLGSLSTSMGV